MGCVKVKAKVINKIKRMLAICVLLLSNAPGLESDIVQVNFFKSKYLRMFCFH